MVPYNLWIGWRHLECRWDAHKSHDTFQCWMQHWYTQHTRAPCHGNSFRISGPLWGNLPVIAGFPSQKDQWWETLISPLFIHQPTVGVWDAMTLTWRHRTDKWWKQHSVGWEYLLCGSYPLFNLAPLATVSKHADIYKMADNCYVIKP